MSTKKIEEELYEYLSKKVVEFANLLHLTSWQYKLVSELDSQNREATLAVERSFEGYTSIYIFYRPGMLQYFKNKDWEAMERLILHELMHIMLIDVSRLLETRFCTKQDTEIAEERLCDNLATVFHRMYISKKNNVKQKQARKNKSK